MVCSKNYFRILAKNVKTKCRKESTWEDGGWRGRCWWRVPLCNTAVLKLKRLKDSTEYLFPIFLLFYLFCIYWDWQGQKCKLKAPKIYEISSELTVISACTHPYNTNTFTRNLIRINLLQLKIHNIWMIFFEIHLDIISFLSHRLFHF